jgi:hypothetical protein
MSGIDKRERNRRIARRELQNRQRRAEDLRAVLATPEGRRVLARVVAVLQGEGRELCRPGEEAIQSTACYDAGTHLLNTLRESAREGYAQMRREIVERELAELAFLENLDAPTRAEEEANEDGPEHDEE